MKKRNLIAILALGFCASLCFTFASCDILKEMAGLQDSTMHPYSPPTESTGEQPDDSSSLPDLPPESSSDELPEPPTRHYVQFISNGSVIHSQYVTEGAYAQPPELPAREGYTFNGWYYTDDTGTTVAWLANESPITAPIILNAIWDAELHQIDYHVGDGFSTQPPSVLFEFLELPVSLAKMPTYDGAWKFAGWYFDEAYTLPATEITEHKDVTVYAKWLPLTQNGLTFEIPTKTFATVVDCDEGLEDVVIPETFEGLPVRSINSAIFSNRENLRSLTIPDSLTILNNPFYNCPNLERITVGEDNPNFTSSDGILYNKEKTEFLHIPYKVTGKITVPTTITKIPHSAFMYRSNITEIVLHEGITAIEANAFYECTAMERINLPKGLPLIPEYAFYRCSRLQKLEIPEGVTDIKLSAFNECYRLKQVTLPSTLTNIVSGAFQYCSIKEVVNKSSLALTAGSSSWTVPNGLVAFHAIQVIQDEADSKLLWEGDYVYYRDGDSYTMVGYTGKDTELVLPNDIHGHSYTIHRYAFYYLKELTSVTVSSGVTELGMIAFSGCASLTKVVIPSSVTTVGESLFLGATGVTVYCEAASKPEGWDNAWNSTNASPSQPAPVVWDYLNANE